MMSRGKCLPCEYGPFLISIINQLKKTQLLCNDCLHGDNYSWKVCARSEEERRRAEELRSGLEKEREELRTKLKDSTDEVRGQTELPSAQITPDQPDCKLKHSIVPVLSDLSAGVRDPKAREEGKSGS